VTILPGVRRGGGRIEVPDPNTASWPEIVGVRDMASRCLRMLRCQRPLAPFRWHGRLTFATDDPQIFAAVLDARSDIYTRAVHPYKELAELYAPAGAFTLGLNRQHGAGRDAMSTIHQVIVDETRKAANELIARCTRWGRLSLLSSTRELVLRSVTRILFDVDSSRWSESFVQAAGLVEAWQTLVRGAPEHAALRYYLAASEIEHRAAAHVLRASRKPLPRGENQFHPRMSIIETVMNSYNGLAVVLTWILYELSRRPDVLCALRSEIDAATAGQVLERRAIGSLHLTMQVVKECLRLYPIAWSLGRKAIREDRLAGQVIPKDAVVVCCTFALHRNPSIWTNPDTFEPQRFASGSGAVRDRFVFLPFGIGPQACPAGQLAPILLQTLLAALLTSVDVAIDRDGPVGMRTLVGLVPSRDLRVRISARTE